MVQSVRLFSESSARSRLLFEHDLFRKPVSTFRNHALAPFPAAGRPTMIYILAALLPPLGLLFNGQPFSALLNVVLIVFCFFFGLVFHVLFLVPSIHAVIAVHMKREDRRHRQMIDAIER